MKLAIDTIPSAGFQAQIDAAFGAGAVQAFAPGNPPPADTEVLLHVLAPVSAAAIAGAPGLRLIQKLGVGVNTIALDAAKAQGVAVCNMPGVNAQAVWVEDLLLLQRVFFEDRTWCQPSRLASPQRMQIDLAAERVKAEKTASYRKILEQVRQIASRHADAGDAGRGEIHRIAKWIHDQWAEEDLLKE